jgi:methyl-accepting chemotaxis protein
MFESNEKLTSSEMGDHHQCSFGKWYDSEGMDKFNHLPILEKVGAHHQAFHALIAEIVQAWNSGRQAEALDRFRKVAPQTDELFVLLDKLALESLNATVDRS